MQIAIENYILLLVFIKITSLLSVTYIIRAINDTVCWTEDMKYYKIYFLVAIAGSLLYGLVNLLHIDISLSWVLSFYIIASMVIFFALKENWRVKYMLYSTAFIIIPLILALFIFNFSNKEYLFIHSIFSFILYIILFFTAIKKAKKLDNIGYNIISFAFLLLVIAAPCEIYHLLNNNIKAAYEIATFSTDSGFLLIIISFLAITLMKEIKAVNKLALTDTLTGMNNRRGLHYMLQTVIPSSNRNNTCFSVLTIDIDFFKSINDTYGHDVGDMVLKEFANIIKTNHRNSDISARFGGEEFVVILPNTNKQTAILTAEKLRKKIENALIQTEDNSIVITASFGIATSCNIIDIDKLLKDADKALYSAKYAGRNQSIHIDDI